MGHETKHVAVNQAHGGILCAAYTRGAGHYRIEHRLKVGWRTGDHPQYVARRRLPCERLVEGAL
jgi:hypothetical protein